MVVLIVKYTVKQGRTEKVLERLKEMADKVKQSEPDCSAYKVHRQTDNPDVLVLYESYKDNDALEAHRNTEHFNRIIKGEVVPLLDKREPGIFHLVIDA